MKYVRERLKWLMFPGLNLHARQRFHRLGRFLSADRNGSPRNVLDAGCGNGMLSYRAYQTGDSITGISIKKGEIARNKRLFNEMMRIPENRMRFLVHDLYEVERLGLKFDSIICTEVMEHIADDSSICKSFWTILKPGGSLHLCCPNAQHPDNLRERIDDQEQGGHVRAGYTFASYRALLEPIGFQIADKAALGGPVRQACNKPLIAAEEKFGFAASLMTFAALLPLTWFDVEPRVPFCIYVRAVKPA
jgi:SAM-dependent methyltransferase